MKPLILIANDDGYRAGGIRELTEAARPLGDVVVVAPMEGQSGMSHAMTVKVPLRVFKQQEEPGFTLYTCNGTPTDCVKIALDHLVPRKPNLLLAGINHGSNSAASVLYSGTMAAAMEGCMCSVPAIGFSVDEHSLNADFARYRTLIRDIIRKVLDNGLPNGICLNVNIPYLPPAQLKGLRVCRQTKGYWREEFVRNVDPYGGEYFWLTGSFYNEEPDADDTDEWALAHNFVSIVPVQIDMTCYRSLPELKSLFEQ